MYFDVQALQISLLGGRIFFKGLRYHGNNETILIHSGFVTWKYWLRNVRELKLERDTDCPSKQSTRDGVSSTKDGSTAEKGGMEEARMALPCRLSMDIKGLEWFIYNRSPAYDTIVAALTGDDSSVVVSPEDSQDGPVDGLKKRAFGNQANLAKTANLGRPPNREKPGEDQASDQSSTTSASSSIEPGAEKDAFENTIGQSYLLQMLPVHIECIKAAVLLGNENTKSIFITKAEQLSGDIDANACRAPDLYKQMYNFKLVEPVIQLKPNDDFKEDQTAAASRAKDDENEKAKKPKHHASMWHRFKRKTWHILQDRVPYFSSSVETFSSSPPNTAHQSFEQFGHDSDHQWQGLSRYLNDEEADGKAKWSSFEYATVTTILESPEATISYYWDEPGKVSNPSMYSKSTSWKTEDINGCRPPTWGIDVIVKGATVNYGPWADRQRADLQKVFFPGICKDAKTAQRLKPGDTRIATQLKVYIQLEEDTILRVPIREESKNWKWKSHADTMTAHLNDRNRRNEKGFRRHKTKTSQSGPEIRPFGWLDLKMSQNATINYTMDMVAGQTGFSNLLKMEIPALEVTTSVNHGLLWSSLDQQLTCDLSNPLGWNAPHDWMFDFRSNAVELFILREHVFLLIDLVDDWTTGPPPDYLTFVPFLYRLNLQFGTFKLYFNVNDANIINNPSDLEDNTFLVVLGTELTTVLLLPFDRYRPHRNAVSFDVKAHTGGIDLHVPPWNTQATFLTSKKVAQLQGLAIMGKYEYCDTTSPSNTDTLLMDVSAQTLEVQLYGFFVRYLMKVKDNYFGEDMHFRTLDEYQQTANAEDPAAALELLKPPFKKSNDLDVVFSINVDHTGALLPTNLYSAAKHVRIDTASLTADLRFTNYYMDLSLCLSPMSFSLGKLGALDSDSESSGGTQLYVDGIEIYGNRLFGLPPTEPTYLCNWDFAVGAITGETSAEFLTQLAFGFNALAFSVDDDENALPAVIPLIEHDVTFLRATVEEVKVWVHVEDSAFMASTGKIDVKFNDWATALYSKKLSLLLPDLVVSCVDSESASRHRSREDHPVETHAYFATALDMTMLARNSEFEKDRQLQQEHIKREDSRTHRTPFFLHDKNDPDVLPAEVQDPPAMWVPPAPHPLPPGYADKNIIAASIISSSSSLRSLRRKSSFISMASLTRSSQKSVIRSQGALSVPARHPSLQLSTSRSRSRQEGTSSRFGNHLRDPSVTSTGRQSSFYSVMEHDDRRGLQSSSVAFSSPFLPPYFPLENVGPSTENVPDFDSEKLDYDDSNDLPVDDPYFDDNVECVSFIIQLKQGIRAYCNPESLKAVAVLLELMQPVAPDDILDSLQIDSMSEIFDSMKQKLTSVKKTDVCVNIPFVRLRFTNASDTGSQYLDRTRPEDQYDLTILGVSLFARSGLSAAQRANIEEPSYSSAIHLRVISAQLSALERFPGMDNSQAAVNGRIEDVVFWFAQSDITGVAGELKLEKVGVEMSSADLEFMASLLHRTTKMAGEQGERFSKLSEQEKARIQVFALLLSARGEYTSDPSFLTKPSYVLRSAQGHLRTKDSWKAITRMRHVYNSLHPDEQLAIRMHLADKELNCPSNVRDQVQDAFDKWRSWDLQDIRKSVLMSKIFGPAVVPEAKAKRAKPAKFTFAVVKAAFVLDPGPKRNEIALTQLGCAVAANVMSPEATFEPADPASIPTTIVQVYCEDTSINLNWELCELAENILKLYNKGQDEAPKTPVTLTQLPLSPTPSKPAKKQEHHIHIIIATDTASIAIDTINLHALSLSKGLKSSIVLVDSQPGGKGMATGMLTAEAATTKIQSHQQEISLYQIRRPTINVSCEMKETKLMQENTWKIAGLSEEITFVVQQEPIALLDIVDTVLGDEVMQLKEMAKACSQKTPTNSPVDPWPLKRKLPVSNKVNVTLFLDKYYISLPLLHSLRYDISGDIARASFSARQDSEFVFDFDIKENQHDMQVQSSGKPRKLSVLQLPPTNGRIVAQMNEGENKMGVFVSVEPIFLDAAAIQSLLSALNRPEISGVIDEIKQGVANIKSRMKEIFETTDAPVKPEVPAIVGPLKPFIYDAHLSLAGLEVFTDAPNGHAGHGKARLTFNLGYVQIEAMNRLNSTGPLLEYPELQLNLRKIVFDLTASTDEESNATCGNFAIAAYFTAGSKLTDNGDLVRSYHLTSDYLEINLFAETASTIVNVVAHLQNKIKELDLGKEVQYFQRLRTPRIQVSDPVSPKAEITAESTATTLFDSMFSLDFSNLQVSWIVVRPQLEDYGGMENLVLSLQTLNLSTRKKNSARLTMDNLMLQMVPPNYLRKVRSHNSALLPQIIFNVGFVSMSNTTRLAFQAKGDALDLRLTSQFVVPGSYIQKSIEGAVEKVRSASAGWMASPSVSEKPSDTTKKMFFGKKRLESLLVDANFEGAVLHLQGMRASDAASTMNTERRTRVPQVGRYGQFSQEEPSSSTTMNSPGLGIKVEYIDNGEDEPSMNAEVKVDKSSNTLFPQVVPLILEITNNIQAAMAKNDKNDKSDTASAASQQLHKVTSAANTAEENILTADPATVLGRTRLNLGIRICAQEFTLSCHPIARVAAKAQFDDIYVTMNTVCSEHHGHFFALSASMENLRASVQHVYSRESTGDFKVKSVILSLMNSKHLKGISGMSAILKISPMKMVINGKQMQDFLLFRDIWIPSDVRHRAAPVEKEPVNSTTQSQAYLVQRYQEVAATAAFPWNATIQIEQLDVQLELGQAIGKINFLIEEFWISTKKNSDWEQNLCLGFKKVEINSAGRLSGFASLEDFRIRTSIQWPEREKAINQTPLVEGAISLHSFRFKVSFDYMAFLVADITSFNFLLYNVRNGHNAKGDRLVSMLDGDSVQVFCTTTTAAQALALYQAVEKLVQEKRNNYQTSLREVERFMQRKVSTASAERVVQALSKAKDEEEAKSPITLHTNLIVNLKEVNIGVYPSSFFDSQVFKIEALNAEFRFAVSVDNGRVHSRLGTTLGQLRIGLAAVRVAEASKIKQEISVEEVVNNATASRGGTILKVPKVEALMETWQSAGSRHIDYIFRSSFEGKVEVGWNYSRISYIRDMYGNHAKSLAQRLGKPLPPSAATIKITGVPEDSPDSPDTSRRGSREQQKITAEVTVPQSRYEYEAVEEPVIEAPQLRDMGEATPPLEWIGLHREKLPNLVHQIVIVTLLELASEAEDAYAKILGNS